MPKTQLPVIASLLLLLGTASCFDTGTTLCATGIRCPADQACAANQDVCITSPCGNGIIDIGEVCDDGNVISGDDCSADCLSIEICGNGITDAAKGEECDDAGESARCDADCSFAECGDGTLNIVREEQCDAAGESAACDTDCTFASCGDGILNRVHGEECDDGAESAFCDVDCTPAACGDGVRNPSHGEECDDGGESINCDSNCTPAVCGDGDTNITRGEECDDRTETADCNTDCTAAKCLDGILNMTAGEQCDESTETETCDRDCTFAICQDGYRNIAADEQCDDGHPSERCDQDCTTPRCGDGVTNPVMEQCDTITETASCNMNFSAAECHCTAAACGDGCINTLAGEECDDGDLYYGGNGCTGSCRLTSGSICGPGTDPGQMSHLGAPAGPTGLKIEERTFTVVTGADKNFSVPLPPGDEFLALPFFTSYVPSERTRGGWTATWYIENNFAHFTISSGFSDDIVALSGKVFVFGFDRAHSAYTPGRLSGYALGEIEDITPLELNIRTKVLSLTSVTQYDPGALGVLGWDMETDMGPECTQHITSRQLNEPFFGSATWHAAALFLAESIRVEQLDFQATVGGGTIVNSFTRSSQTSEIAWIPVIDRYDTANSGKFPFSIDCSLVPGGLACETNAYERPSAPGGAGSIEGRIVVLEYVDSY